MSKEKKISRSSLYSSDSEIESNEPYIQPNIEFEFIEVDNQEDEDGKDQEAVNDTQEQEYEFPLFGGGVVGTKSSDEPTEEFDFPLFASNKHDNDGEDRGRSSTRIMKISLREESVENIKQERPESYYFATYSKDDKSKFISAAITAQDIFNFNERYPIIDTQPHKCLDVSLYNQKVEHELRLQKKRSRTRPGKKKREATIACRERKQEREKLLVKLEKDRLNKLKKKMFHKRGGKKHKKTTSKASQPAVNKPKYKTEA